MIKVSALSQRLEKNFQTHRRWIGGITAFALRSAIKERPLFLNIERFYTFFRDLSREKSAGFLFVPGHLVWA